MLASESRGTATVKTGQLATALKANHPLIFTYRCSWCAAGGHYHLRRAIWADKTFKLKVEQKSREIKMNKEITTDTKRNRKRREGEMDGEGDIYTHNVYHQSYLLPIAP